MELVVTDRSGNRTPLNLDELHRVMDLIILDLGIPSPWGLQDQHLAKPLGWWLAYFRIVSLEGKLRHETIHEPPFLFGLAKLLEVSSGQVRPP